MKKLYFALLLLSPAVLFAQPTVTNCEAFNIGTVLRFQKCNTSVSAGPSGAAQTWDFSGLISLPDTSTEWMVPPSSTSLGGSFPTATFVEKYSNGTFVYVNASHADSSYLVGYADTTSGSTTYYDRPILFSVRPITYNQTSVDTFTDNLVSSSYNQHGTGVATVSADGYGTLILPGGSHSNMLRIRVTQVSSDTSSFGVSITTSVSWVWFDGIHTSALLKIDSTQSGSYQTKSVEYLIDEATTGIADIPASFSFHCYPNPAVSEIHISTIADGTLTISDALGREVQQVSITERNMNLSVVHLTPGMYTVGFSSGAGVQTSKLVID